MDAKKKEAIKNCESFDELLDAEYGERGTEDRETFEAEAKSNWLQRLARRKVISQR